MSQARARTLQLLEPFWTRTLTALLGEPVALNYYQGWSQERTLAEALAPQRAGDLERGQHGAGRTSLRCPADPGRSQRARSAFPRTTEIARCRAGAGHGPLGGEWRPPASDPAPGRSRGGARPPSYGRLGLRDPVRYRANCSSRRCIRKRPVLAILSGRFTWNKDALPRYNNSRVTKVISCQSPTSTIPVKSRC